MSAEPDDRCTDGDDRCIASIETALYALARRLKQARLHEHFLRQAGGPTLGAASTAAGATGPRRRDC